MRALIVSLVASPLFAAPGDVGTPEHTKAANLVKQLGHARYAVREAAAKQLVDMGGAAAAALREGQKSTDEEVRARSVALLPKAIALDWQRKADAYLADTAGTGTHHLPLLAEFEKLVGKPDAELKKLFAAMVRTNGPLLEAAADVKAIPKALSERSRQLLETHRVADKQVKIDPAEVAAVLFVQSLYLGPKDRSRGERTAPALLLGNPGVADAVSDKDAGPAFRRLLVRWAESLPANDTISRRSFCLAARQYALPEAVPELAKYAKDSKADVLSVRALAIEALGKAGGTEAAAVLEGLVSDTTDVFNFGGGMESYYLGDSALAALLTLQKKKLSDYGLNQQIGIGFDFGDGGEGVNLSLHGFQSSDARKRGVQKWKDETAKKK